MLDGVFLSNDDAVTNLSDLSNPDNLAIREHMEKLLRLFDEPGSNPFPEERDNLNGLKNLMNPSLPNMMEVAT